MIPGEVFAAITVAVLAVIVAALVIPYWVSARRNRRTGQHGIVQRSQLVCPKCHRSFSYQWVPGYSLTAVRLGKSRYMACPLCRSWSIFNIWDAPPPPATSPGFDPR
jgi:hypothetical protein